MIQYEDGAKFNGQFKNNKKHGIGEVVKKDGQILYEEWLDGELIKQSEKLKASGVNHDNIDYSQFNSETFDKYLDTKSKQHINKELSQIKSKYFTLEFAKKLKSKNPDSYLDSIKLIHHTNSMVYEKPDMNTWIEEDVIELFKQLGFAKFADKIVENKIDGTILLALDNDTLSGILGIEDKAEKAALFKDLDLIKKLNLQTDYFKYYKSIKLVPDSSSEILKQNIEGDKTKNSDNLEVNPKKNTDSPSVPGSSPSKGIIDPVVQKDQTINLAQEIAMVGKNLLILDFSSSVHLNGLNYFINYNELSLLMKVGEGGKHHEFYIRIWRSVFRFMEWTKGSCKKTHITEFEV